MWNYFTDNLSSVVLINERTNEVIIKIYGLEDKLQAELFAHYAMNKLEFDYHVDQIGMPSRAIH
jgi:hypothetical protein